MHKEFKVDREYLWNVSKGISEYEYSTRHKRANQIIWSVIIVQGTLVFIFALGKIANPDESVFNEWLCLTIIGHPAAWYCYPNYIKRKYRDAIANIYREQLGITKSIDIQNDRLSISYDTLDVSYSLTSISEIKEINEVCLVLNKNNIIMTMPKEIDGNNMAKLINEKRLLTSPPRVRKACHTSC